MSYFIESAQSFVTKLLFLVIISHAQFANTDTRIICFFVSMFNSILATWYLSLTARNARILLSNASSLWEYLLILGALVSSFQFDLLLVTSLPTATRRRTALKVHGYLAIDPCYWYISQDTYLYYKARMIRSVLNSTRLFTPRQVLLLVYWTCQMVHP